MLKKIFIDNINRRFSESLATSSSQLQFINDTRKELQQSLRIILESELRGFNLVSREEFDAQKKVLARTRQLVTQLERHVLELEQKTESNNT
jgi:ubiquinone biosynthesis accessory factor UbiK